jgi:hypothetical protein
MHASKALWLALTHLDNIFTKPPGLATISLYQHELYCKCPLELSDRSALQALGLAPTAVALEGILAGARAKIDEEDVEADDLEDSCPRMCAATSHVDGGCGDTRAAGCSP